MDPLKPTKVTPEYLDSRIEDISYFHIHGSRVTVCHIRMKNGYDVVETAACVADEDFNLKIGEELAYKKAISELYRLEGYLLRERMYLRSFRERTAATKGGDPCL